MLWQERLTEERNFWQVYIKASGVVGSRFNKTVALLAGIVILVMVLILGVLDSSASLSPSALASVLREWAKVGITYTTSILGFLIAGFSIFATITKNKLFVLLAKVDHDFDDDENANVEISELKFVLFNFLIIFMHYMAFLMVTLFIDLFLSKGGILTTSVVSLLRNESILAQRILPALSLVVVGSWFVYILLLLKSFIWNLYQSVLIIITVEALVEESRENTEC